MSTIPYKTSSAYPEKHTFSSGSKHGGAPARKDDTQVQALVESACRWYEEGAKEPFPVGKIAIEDLVQLENLLRARELKIRVDWSFDTQEAFLNMTTRMHEQPAVWLMQQKDAISAWLARIALCGTPSVSSAGTAATIIGESRWSPDQSLYLRYSEDQTGQGDTPKRYTIPRVVMETAFSQSPDAALHKAWGYLINSDDCGVHAVIIVSMKYPVTDERNFKAEATVWIRATTGDIDRDFPLDSCVHPRGEQHPERGEHASTVAMNDTVSEERSPSASPTSPTSQTTWGSNTTASEPTPYECGKYQAPEGGGWILRRSAPFVFYDETSPGTCVESLLLEADDFLRPCDARPDMYISGAEATIKLPLHALKKEIDWELQVLRDIIRNEAASATQPPPAPEPEPEPEPARPAPRVYPTGLGKRRAVDNIDVPTNKARRS